MIRSIIWTRRNPRNEVILNEEFKLRRPGPSTRIYVKAKSYIVDVEGKSGLGSQSVSGSVREGRDIRGRAPFHPASSDWYRCIYRCGTQQMRGYQYNVTLFTALLDNGGAGRKRCLQRGALMSFVRPYFRKCRWIFHILMCHVIKT